MVFLQAFFFDTVSGRFFERFCRKKQKSENVKKCVPYCFLQYIVKVGMFKKSVEICKNATKKHDCLVKILAKIDQKNDENIVGSDNRPTNGSGHVLWVENRHFGVDFSVPGGPPKKQF